MWPSRDCEVHVIICTQPHPLLSCLAKALEAFDKVPFVYFIISVYFFLFFYLPQGIFHFQLGRGEPMLHTRLRPHCKEFLEKIAKLYELHVFTFGSRLYAHTIAGNRLDYLHFSFFLSVVHLYCLLVSTRGKYLLRVLSAWDGSKNMSVSNMSAAGTIFNLSAINTDIKFNLSISSSFFIIVPLRFNLWRADIEL